MPYRPSHRHALVLQAAIASPDQALSAWKQWRLDFRVADADVEESRLLPIVAVRAVGQPGLTGIIDPELANKRHNRRHDWTANMLRASACRDVADSLRNAGIDSVFFKGIGMLSAYADSSVRTMNDADMLVPWALRREAIEHLSEHGFVPLYGLPLSAVYDAEGTYPGFGMTRADGFELDVHWRPLHILGHHPDQDDVIFANAKTVRLGGADLRIPDPSHHIVLVVGHGMRHDSEAHLISMVDACQLLASDQFDASRAADLARRYERTTAMTDACKILMKVFQVGVATELVGVPERIEILQAQLHRRTVGDRLLARQLAAPPGPVADRAERVRATYVTSSQVPLLQGGMLRGVAEATRIRWGLTRIRHLTTHGLWVLGGRRELLDRFRRSGGGRKHNGPLLAIGDCLQVGSNDTANSMLRSGWWPTEGSHAWTQSIEAVIAFDLELQSEQRCNVVIGAVANCNEHHPILSVDVRVNGKRRTTWCYQFDRPMPATQQIDIGRDDLKGGHCQLLLIVAGSSSPRSAGTSTDSRTLGLAVSTVSIQPIS